MVVTRSYEYTRELQSSQGNESLTLQIRKRNAPQDSNSKDSNSSLEGSKRRRVITGPQKSISSTEPSYENYDIANDQPRLDEDKRRGIDGPSVVKPLVANTKEEDESEGKEDSFSVNPLEANIKEDDEREGKEDSSGIRLLEVNTKSEDSAFIRQTVSTEEIKKETSSKNNAEEAELSEHEVGHDILDAAKPYGSLEPSQMNNIDVTAQLPKPTHKRFGGEDAELDQPRTEQEHSSTIDRNPASETILEIPTYHESEDEEPETLTAAVGLEQSRSVTAETLRFVGRYRPIDISISRILFNSLQTASG